MDNRQFTGFTEPPQPAGQTVPAGAPCESRAGRQAWFAWSNWGPVWARDSDLYLDPSALSDVHPSRSGGRPCSKGLSPARSERGVGRRIGVYMGRLETEGSAE